MKILFAVAMVTTLGPPSEWVFLGSTPTGQRVTVEANSLEENGRFRVGWFKLHEAGEVKAGVQADYLLVDCQLMKIGVAAVRTYAPDGTVAGEKGLSEAEAAFVSIKPRTPLDLVHRSVCTPRLNYIREIAKEQAAERTKRISPRADD